VSVALLVAYVPVPQLEHDAAPAAGLTCPDPHATQVDSVSASREDDEVPAGHETQEHPEES